VPVPPLVTANNPVTSEEPRLTAPIFNSPFTDLTMPVAREDRVVEPLGLIVNREVPVWEATVNGLAVP
jgi:hypothetical protein